MADSPRTVEWIRDPATGSSPEDDPRKASFRWKHGESVIQTEDFTEEELEAQIRDLEQSGGEVPSAFREALDSFRSGN